MVNVPNYMDHIMNDGGPAAHLLSDNNRAINDSVNMIMKMFKKDLIKVCYLEQPVLTNIRKQVVDGSGHIQTGSLDWSFTITSPIHQRRMKIGVSMQIVGGRLLQPLIFENSTGDRFTLNEQGVKKAMRIPDKIRKVRFAPSVQRSLKEER